MGDIRLGYPAAGIRYRDHHAFLGGLYPHGDGAALFRMTHGVIQQDHQHLLDPVRVRKPVHCRPVVQGQMDALLFRRRGIAAHHVAEQLLHIYPHDLDILRPRLEPG